MRKYNIQDLDQLNAEISLLKANYTLQGNLIKSDVKVYAKQLTPANLIKRFVTPSNLFKADDKLNVSSKLMSMILPFVLNSTIFRGSGFITKALVGMATSKVGKTLDAEHLTSMFSSVKSWLGGVKKKKEKSSHYLDYGIPPDSETY
jgi:hypothetical protein